MKDETLALAFLILLALLAGCFGGLLAAAGVFWARVRWPRLLLSADTNELPVRVQLRAEAVQLPIRVRQPDPVAVEVITTGAPTTRQLAGRVIATFPTIGPSDLAAIVQCSKSTAHAILLEARAGRLELPTVPEPDDESFDAER